MNSSRPIAGDEPPGSGNWTTYLVLWNSAQDSYKLHAAELTLQAAFLIFLTLLLVYLNMRPKNKYQKIFIYLMFCSWCFIGTIRIWGSPLAVN